MKKKLLSILLVLVMLICALPFTGISVSAAETTLTNVKYIDSEGNEQVCPSAIVLDGTVSFLNKGWYVVTGDVTYGGSGYCLSATDDAHIILADGCKLTVSNATWGIRVSAGKSVHIYGQAAQTGTFETYGITLSAIGGISGPSPVKLIEINGGILNFAAGIAGPSIGSYLGDVESIVINGGNITAGAGIGGPAIGVGEDGKISDITINGGRIYAVGNDNGGAAIGTGDDLDSECERITINGGNITAKGGLTSAAIGGGCDGKVGDISITGGEVVAVGGKYFGAGIGAGAMGSVNSISITGGNVYAEASGEACDAIGNDYYGNHSVTVATYLTVKADNNSNPTTVITNNGGELKDSLSGKRYVKITPNVYNVSVNTTNSVRGWIYLDGDSNYAYGDTVKLGVGVLNGFKIDSVYYQTSDGVKHPITPVNYVYSFKMPGSDVTVGMEFSTANGGVYYTYPVYNTSGTPASGLKGTEYGSVTGYTKLTSSSTTLRSGWYLAEGNIAINGTVTVNGTVNLILADGCSLSATNFNVVSGSFTIYGQEKGTGSLTATGKSGCAGIGGISGKSGSGILIHGGNITAKGGLNAAGIGGGLSGSASNIIITGGTVKAYGGAYAAGIGGGKSGSLTNIVILRNATVIAHGGQFGAGIGGGQLGNATGVTLVSSKVEAYGGSLAAGIGGGYGGKATNVSICNGSLLAKGGNGCNGIGSGAKAAGTSSNIKFVKNSVINANLWLDDVSTEYGESDMTATLNGVNKVSLTSSRSTSRKHTHEWSFEAEGDTLWATCGAESGHQSKSPERITVNAPEDLTYNGEKKEATLNGSVDGVEDPEIKYFCGNEELTEAPVEAGTYTAKITLGDATAEVTFTIVDESKKAADDNTNKTEDTKTEDTKTEKKVEPSPATGDGLLVLASILALVSALCGAVILRRKRSK